jgi:hypothetical protein
MNDETLLNTCFNVMSKYIHNDLTILSMLGISVKRHNMMGQPMIFEIEYKEFHKKVLINAFWSTIESLVDDDMTLKMQKYLLEYV